MPTRQPSLSVALDPARELRRARAEQNVVLGFLAGFMAALALSAAWVAIAHLGGVWAGWCAPLAGAAAGAAVRFFGRGFDLIFGVLAVAGTLVGCGIATVLVGSRRIAEHTDLTLWQSLRAFQPHDVRELLLAGCGPLDGVMVAAAVIVAWCLSRRRTPDFWH